MKLQRQLFAIESCSLDQANPRFKAGSSGHKNPCDDDFPSCSGPRLRSGCRNILFEGCDKVTDSSRRKRIIARLHFVTIFGVFLMTKRATRRSVKAKRSVKGKAPPKPNIARVKVLEENTAALARHTKELHRNSSALAAHTVVMARVSAKQLVYSVLEEPLTLPDTTPLSKLLLDSEALAGTASAIRELGVNVDTGLVQACKTIADLVRVVAAAMR
jgi:hypothetical protein